MAKLLFIQTFTIISAWSAVFDSVFVAWNNEFNGKMDNKQMKLGEWNVRYDYVKVSTVVENKHFALLSFSSFYIQLSKEYFELPIE